MAAVQSMIWHRSTAALLAIALVVVGTAQADAKERLVRHLGIDAKLLPENVYAIDQDEAGFLWFGTAAGLVRYDGERLVPWVPGTIRGVVARLAIHDGTIIAVVWDGPIYRTSTRGDAVALTGPDGAPLSTARDVFFDRAGRLWLATRAGLLRSADRGATWTSPLGRTGAGARTMAVREGPRELYVLTTTALYTIDGADRATLVSELPADDAAMDVLAMPDGSVLVTLSSGWILRLRGGAIVDRIRGRARAGPMARRGDTAWVALDHALMAIRPDRPPEELPVEHAIANRGRCIFVDREGSLWVGNGRGVFQFPEPDTVAWTVEDGLPPDGAVRLALTGEGLWIAHWGFKLALIEPSRARLVPDVALHMLCTDARGVLWGIAVAQGQPHGTIVSRHPGQPFVHHRVVHGDTKCAPARDGGLYLVADEGLWHTTGDTLRALVAPPRGTGQIQVREGASGTLWFSSDDRLCRASAAAIHGGAGTWACEAMKLESVTGLVEMPSGAVWLSSDRTGLRRRDPATARIDVWPGAAMLPSMANHVLEPAADGGVWLGGAGYLMRVEERLDAAVGWVVLESLGPDNGVSAFNTLDVLEAPDGTLWATTAAGVLELPRSARNRPPPILTPALIEAAFDGRRRADEGDGEVHLAPGANAVELQLASLSYRDPAAIRFRVRARAGGPWSTPARRSNIQLVDLPAGSYQIEVAASVDEQTWAAASVALAFVVDRPWYLRPWVWALAALAAAAALFAAHRVRVAMARRLERQRTSIAMDLHDEVGSGLGGIGLMAGLTADGALDDEARRTAAARIAQTAKTLGESLSGIVTSLRDDDASVRALAGQLADLAASLFPEPRPDASPRLVVAFPAAWPAGWQDQPLARGVARNLRLIVAEALHNAAKHARATEVVLGAAASRDELAFWVEDDGRGTPAEARRGGLGLTSMRRRARRIGAAFAVASPRSAHERGTKVIVTVPARAAKPRGRA